MILDRLENAAQYESVHPRLSQAFAFLRRPDLDGLAPGRHEIAGETVFALLQEYKSKPPQEGFWESHRKYLDVQYVIHGAERMGYANLAQLVGRQPYSVEKDLLILDGDGDFVTVRAGMFAIFTPQDGHMPCLAVDQPETVRKVVVKVAI